MKLKVLFVLLLASLAAIPARSQVSGTEFKVVGYYSLRAAMSDFSDFPFNRVTHVNLYFMNPDTMGNFSRDYSSLEPFISKAHKKNVKVLFSIAGGGAHPYYHKLLKDDRREAFIEDLIELVEKHNFDGIDIDIEGGDIDDNYEVFVLELGEKLKSRQKLFTAAIAVYYKDQFTDLALSQYDFVNVMVYDRTGPWRPDKPGQHSSYQDAIDDLEYFGTDRKIAAGKMVLGVPFYGYGFGKDSTIPVKSMSYKDIVKKFPGSEKKDELIMDDGMTMYYNGIPTMTEKTRLAMQKASGIMIWQLQGDAKGSKSLLKTIWKTAKK